MKILFQSVCIFLIVSIFAAIAGFGLFTIGGSFSDTMENFGSSIQSVDNALVQPIQYFFKFFGLSQPFGGISFMYHRTPDDAIYSPYITDDVEYISVVFASNTQPSLSLSFHKDFSFGATFLIFYDVNGQFIKCYLRYDGQLYTDPTEVSFITEFDATNCYFNPLSKHEFVDINFSFIRTPGLDWIDDYRISYDSALIEYKFSGTLFDAQGRLY